MTDVHNYQFAPKTSKGLVIGLVVSVAINLALTGFIAGRLNHPADTARMAIGAHIMKMAHKLPEQDRQLLRSTLKDHKQELLGLMTSARASRDAVKDAVIADPFDAGKLTLALDDSRQKGDALRDLISGLITEIAPKISPEGRATLARLRQENAGQRDDIVHKMESRFEEITH